VFIELIDTLRCPRTHEESSLVLGTARMDRRNVLEGILGCPVCRARYPITAGVADLRAEAGAPAGPAGVRAPVPAPVVAGAAPDPDEAVRLAALLGLADAHGFAVLFGDWTVQAAGVSALTETHLLLVNPTAGVAIGRGMSGMIVGDRLPIAAARARALAVDRTVSPEFLARALSTVQPKGRIVAPPSLPVPQGVTELARDARSWVGERDVPPSGFVPLARGSR
jgi:uncharacterized protein YbaR (Trm112 family)